MPTREKRIFSALKADVDAVVLMNATDPNLDYSFFYVTGIPSGLFEGSVAIVRRNGTEVLCSELEELSARRAGVKCEVFQNRDDRLRIMRRKLGRLRRIGINAKELTHANFLVIKACAKQTRLVDVSESIQEARMIKDSDEIARIRRACQIASKVGDAIPELVREGMTETEAAAEINYAMMTSGASAPGFITISAFGPGSAEPHYVPSSRKLSKGQLALFDYGATYRRYVSDITRTFVCSAPSARQREMHEVVLRAQEAALDAIRHGVRGAEVDAAARSIIDSSRFKNRFIHSTGHGLGLCAHDPGSISSARDMELREGMVLTVEPGVYVKSIGGVRIEDDVLVTKRGCRVLTTASKELRIL